MTAGVARSRGYASLQVLRGLAALGIVLFHLLPFEAKYLPGTAIVPSGFGAGRAAVDVFFALSGFVVTWTTMTSPSGGVAAVQFLVRRLARIYPTYWLMCFLLLAALEVSPSLLGGGAGHPDVVATLLLLPSPGRPLLLVSWTLVFEVYFYIVLAVVLTCAPRLQVRAWLIGCWVALVVAGRLLVHPDRSEVTLDLVLSPLVLEFVAGSAVAFICQVGVSERVGWATLIAGAAILVTALAWSESLFAQPWLRAVVFGASSASLLIGCVTCDATLRRLLPAAMQRLGDASYSLYLSHLLSVAVVGRLWSSQLATTSPLNHVAALVCAVAVSIGVGGLAYRFAERPLLRLTRFTLVRPRTAPAAGVA
jgi:peptidoglycan/LPS O-acetylase OafA/YrhL